MSLTNVSMTINGKLVSAAVEPRTLLIHYLRENLGLTGAHIGCDTSHCGACTVDVDGRSVKSCTMFAIQATGANVLTIEGMVSADGALSAPSAPAMPSMVSREAPAAWTANIVQDFTDRPSTSTVQAPQWEVSQPICAPVRPRFSRR